MTPGARRHFRKWRRNATVGFLILFGASVFNSIEVRQSGDEARDRIIQSSRVVIVEGCNRDFRTIQNTRGVLESAKEFVEQQRKRGDISDERASKSIEFYDQEIRRNRLPDCRASVGVITDNTNGHKVIPPEPLYPGSPLEDSEITPRPRVVDTG